MTAIETNAAAREDILASIKQSLAASVPFDPEWEKYHRNGADADIHATYSDLSHVDVIDNLRVNLESVGAVFSFVRSESEISDIIADLIEQREIKQIAVSDSQFVGHLVERFTCVKVLDHASKDELFDCDLGITCAQWAISETGTLVLESDKESSRLTSLVPPIHLCVVKAENIVKTMGEALELISRDLSRTVTFITGASRTSDIELTLAMGVHGPKELHVIVAAV